MRFDLGEASRWSRPRSCTCARSSTSCCGSCAATPTSATCTSTASRSGTSGRTSTASSGPIYGAQWRAWATADGRHIDQMQRVLDLIRKQSGLAPHHRQRVERRRARADGARAVPRAVPVLRRARAAVVPAVSAQRRRVPRRAVQHRLLRAADAHDRAADATSRPASSSGPAAIATSTRTTSSRRTSSSRASRCRCRSS